VLGSRGLIQLYRCTPGGASLVCDSRVCPSGRRGGGAQIDAEDIMEASKQSLHTATIISLVFVS